MSWIGGLAEWTDGDTTYLSIAFTWKVPEAHARAIFAAAQGRKVVVGGPALAFPEMREMLQDVATIPLTTEVRRGKPRTVPSSHPAGDIILRHNPLATLASRGCSEDCYFCTVPVIDGGFTLLPDFAVRPILCDNNLSALPSDYQDHIIDRYHSAGVRMIDANSGFEPKTFDEAVYRRWAPLVNVGGGPWRFGYDTTTERDQVRRVMRMLENEPQKRKRVYVLIGNEPFAECMARIQDVLDHGCEPHCQPYLSLNALEREPRARHDWTVQKIKDVARWANKWVWKKAPFADYDRFYRHNTPAETYDNQQGLFA